MPRIVSIQPSQNVWNRIKGLWEYFQSFESFTKVTIITSLLIILSTPFIVGNRQIFTPRAEVGESTALGPQEPQFLSNQLLIKVKGGVKAKVKENKDNTGLPSLDQKFKEHKVKKFQQLAKKGASSNTSHDLFAWYEITIDAPSEILQGKLNHTLGVIQTNRSNANANANQNPTQPTLQPLITQLKSDPNIEDIDLNYIVHTAAFPNDPYYSSTGSWGQSYGDLWGMKKINLEPAWDQTTGSSSIIVADIDTGVDRNHEDMVSSPFRNVRFSAK